MGKKGNGRKQTPRKSQAELQAELAALKRHCIGDNVTKVVTTLIKYGVFLGIAYYGWRSIDSLAGKNTTADISVNGSAGLDIPGTSILAWPVLAAVLGIAIGGAGLLYGHHQRKLRGDTVERLQDRIKELESAIDPNRSSSNLTARGETNPDDK